MKKLIMLIGFILIAVLSNGQWTKGYFLDDFRDTTKNPFISQHFDGIFSNSATVDSKLTADLIFSYSTYFDPTPSLILNFNLYEYDKGPVANFSASNILKVKTSNGTVHQFKFSGGGFISFHKNPYTPEKYSKNLEELNAKLGILPDEANSVLLDLFKNEISPMKFFIRTNDGSTYNFKVDLKGFNVALNLLQK